MKVFRIAYLGSSLKKSRCDSSRCQSETDLLIKYILSIKNTMDKYEKKELMELYAEQNRQKCNKYEKMFCAKLDFHNIKYIHQFPFHYGGTFIIVDFIIESKKLIIEIDGISHKEKVDDDIKRDKYLTEHGYRVIRILNKDVELFNTKRLLMYSAKKKDTPKKKKQVKEKSEYKLRYGYID